MAPLKADPLIDITQADKRQSRNSKGRNKSKQIGPLVEEILISGSKSGSIERNHGQSVYVLRT